MLTELMNRECLIVRSQSAEPDDFGLDDPGPEPELIEAVCEIQQRRRDEPDSEGELSDTEWVGFFPPTVTLLTSDKILVDGEAYEVTGDPWRARDPFTQTESHLEASLRRTAGAADEVGS